MGATPIRSFRLDDETWTEFSNLCKDAKSTPSAEIIGFIRECIRRKGVAMSDETFAPDPVATAIENRLIATFEARYGLVPLAGSEGMADSTYSTYSDEDEESEDDSEEMTDSTYSTNDDDNLGLTDSTNSDENEEMTDSTNSIDNDPIESVSSSNVTPTEKRLEPIQSTPSPATVAMEAIDNGKIAAHGESAVEVAKKTEGAIGPGSVLSVGTLAKRFKISNQTMLTNQQSKPKADQHLYCLKDKKGNPRDPKGYVWEYSHSEPGKKGNQDITHHFWKCLGLPTDN